MALLRGVFIVAAKRTPFGAYGGLLKDFTATDLTEFAARAALSAGRVSPETIDSVIVGNVIQSSSDAAYLARHVGLRVGVPKEIPALTVNRLCGSGFQSIVSGCQEICVKDAEVVLCGGTESMSQSPYCVRNIRFGTKFGSDLKMEDALWSGLTDEHIRLPMGITAENLAAKHNISREDCDKYALQSQQRWKAANDAGYFNNEMAPIEVKTKKGKQTMQVDEHARPQTTLEQLHKLPPVFKKEGTVTAGNASGVSDGAGVVIIASEEAVKKHNFTPLARIVGYFVSGCDPSIMGIGPVPAINGALKKTGQSLKDMDLVEVNEAFAPQYLAVEKSLGLDPSKTNVNGGAIALGHPLGGSGTRITAHLVHELRLAAAMRSKTNFLEAFGNNENTGMVSCELSEFMVLPAISKSRGTAQLALAGGSARSPVDKLAEGSTGAKPPAFQTTIPRGKKPQPSPLSLDSTLGTAGGSWSSPCCLESVHSPHSSGFLVQSLPHSQVPGESVPMRTAPYCGQESATSLGYCPFLRYMCLLILSCVDKAIIWLLLAFANANLGGQKVEKVGRHWSSV